MAMPTTVGYAPPLNAPPPTSDMEGVGYLKIGSGLGVAVQALFWSGLAIFYLIFTALQSSTTAFGTSGTLSIPSWITVNTFYLAVGALAGGLFLGIVSYVFYFLGFREIKKGAPNFGAPTTLMVIGLIGYLLAALGIILIVGTVVSAINSVTTGTVSAGSAALDLNAILGGFAMIGLGGLLGLIGVIGLVLGNWRAGSRYQESTAKIGAILSVIPFVSIVGYLLLLVGYVHAGTKLKNGWIPTGYGSPMPPPAYYGAPGVPPPPPPYYPPSQAAPPR